MRDIEKHGLDFIKVWLSQSDAKGKHEVGRCASSLLPVKGQRATCFVLDMRRGLGSCQTYGGQGKKSERSGQGNHGVEDVEG